MRASLKAVLAARIVSGSLVIAGPALGTPIDGLNLASAHLPEMRLPYIHASLLWSAPMRILPIVAPKQSAEDMLRAHCSNKTKTQSSSRLVD